MDINENDVEELVSIAKRIKKNHQLSENTLSNVVTLSFLANALSYLIITYMIACLGDAGELLVSNIAILLMGPLLALQVDTHFFLAKSNELIKAMKRRSLLSRFTRSEMQSHIRQLVVIEKSINKNNKNSKNKGARSFGVLLFCALLIIFYQLIKIDVMPSIYTDPNNLILNAFFVITLFLINVVFVMVSVKKLVNNIFGQGLGEDIIRFVSRRDGQTKAKESLSETPLVNGKPISMGELREQVEKETLGFIDSLDIENLSHFAAELDMEYMLRRKYKSVILNARPPENDNELKSTFYYLGLDSWIESFINNLSKDYSGNNLTMIELYFKLDYFLDPNGKYSEYREACLRSKKDSLSDDEYNKSKALELKVSIVLDSFMELFGPYSVVLRDILIDRVERSDEVSLYSKGSLDVAKQFKEAYQS